MQLGLSLVSAGVLFFTVSSGMAVRPKILLIVNHKLSNVINSFINSYINVINSYVNVNVNVINSYIDMFPRPGTRCVS